MKNFVFNLISDDVSKLSSGQELFNLIATVLIFDQSATIIINSKQPLSKNKELLYLSNFDEVPGKIRLISNINKFKRKDSKEGVLDGKTFVLTGSLSLPRKEMLALIQSAGGKITTSVSHKTYAVITEDNNSNSSKAKMARELGIPFWNETKLRSVLASSS